eukprot:291410-Hanusia_phi.AAC.4
MNEVAPDPCQAHGESEAGRGRRRGEEDRGGEAVLPCKQSERLVKCKEGWLDRLSVCDRFERMLSGPVQSPAEDASLS